MLGALAMIDAVSGGGRNETDWKLLVVGQQYMSEILERVLSACARASFSGWHTGQ